MQPPALPLIEVWSGLTPYAEGVVRMEGILAEVLAGGAERIIFCEHEAVLTVGSSGDFADAAGVVGVPVVATGRGGKVTYHGPGQRVIYLVVQLDRWGKDVRIYVQWLQEVIIKTLKEFGIVAFAGAGDEVGVWVDTAQGVEKIAAIGVRVRRGVAYHGFALNVCNDLNIYTKFVPCGITDKGVTSMKVCGFAGALAAVDSALAATVRAELVLLGG